MTKCLTSQESSDNIKKYNTPFVFLCCRPNPFPLREFLNNVDISPITQTKGTSTKKVSEIYLTHPTPIG